MSIDGTLSASFVANDRRAVGLSAGAVISASRQPSISFVNGVGASGANTLYSAARILPGASESLDLTGALLDQYGSILSNARIKGLYINNIGLNPIVVGAAGVNAWATLLNAAGTITLPPGAFVIVATPDATGWAVTAGTGDLLQIAGTAGQSYEVGILGAST